MQKNNSAVIGGVIVLVILIALFAIPRFTDPTLPEVKAWNAEGIGCLINGHTNLAQHIHPILHIFVDGVPEYLPSNIGNVKSCLAEIHTHDTSQESDVIHIETVEAGKNFVLNDFLAVWGKKFDRPGFTAAMTVDGKPNAELGNVMLKDKEVIVLTYTPSGQGAQ